MFCLLLLSSSKNSTTMKPHAISCFCHKQSYLKTIPNLFSLSALILSFLAILHFSYRHVLFQLNYFDSSIPSSSTPSLISANNSTAIFSANISTTNFSDNSAAIFSAANNTANSSATISTTSGVVSFNYSSSSKTLGMARKCDIFKGEWIPDPEGPYYTNMTCSMIQDHQNCMKYGRPDMEFLKWRWKPAGCELPRFDPRRFLELVRGKSMAFVGDSLARNHMQSLLCLLSRVVLPEDRSTTRDENRRYFYSAYNFTISMFWSPFLVKGGPAGGGGDSLWNIYLDEVDQNWASRVEHLDYVIISTGTWFTRPSFYFKKRQPLGCNYCQNMVPVTLFSANRMAFRSAYKAIDKLKRFKGVTFLRTVSPSHFENGKWDQGGTCRRTRPARPWEARFEWTEMEMYNAQVKEFKKAKRDRKGMELRLLDATAAMLLRPDGHPSVYGHWPEQRVQLHNDCVHWCLPGPVDLWNELLLQMLSN